MICRVTSAIVFEVTVVGAKFNAERDPGEVISRALSTHQHLGFPNSFNLDDLYSQGEQADPDCTPTRSGVCGPFHPSPSPRRRSDGPLIQNTFSPSPNEDRQGFSIPRLATSRLLDENAIIYPSRIDTSADVAIARGTR